VKPLNDFYLIEEVNTSNSVIEVPSATGPVRTGIVKFTPARLVSLYDQYTLQNSISVGDTVIFLGSNAYEVEGLIAVRHEDIIAVKTPSNLESLHVWNQNHEECWQNLVHDKHIKPLVLGEMLEIGWLSDRIKVGNITLTAAGVKARTIYCDGVWTDHHVFKTEESATEPMSVGVNSKLAMSPTPTTISRDVTGNDVSKSTNDVTQPTDEDKADEGGITT
jgi:hypothetical protein